MALEQRVAELEQLVARLTLEVRALQAASDARSEQSFTFIPDTRAPASQTRASPAAEPASPLTPASRASAAPAAVNSGQPLGAKASLPVRTLTANESRCVSGNRVVPPTLPCGRASRGFGARQIPQSSRYWLVLRDFAGANIEPAVVCQRFADCARLCKRGSDLGDSICIGLPARQDIIAVAAAADIALPASW